MLPDSVVDRYTLQEGRTCPALSLYVTIDPNGVDGLTIVGSETRAELVPIAANLRTPAGRYGDEAALAAGTGDYPFARN
jgi:exoribonuclease-2